MTFSNVQDFSPEVMTTPSAVSVMLSIGVLVWIGCAVGLRGRDRRRDGPVGAQGTAVGVVDGDVVRAEVVLRVAFGHLLAAEDLVVGAVGPGGFQQAAGCRGRLRCRWRVRRSG